MNTDAPPAVPGLRRIPLAEMPALGPDVLEKVISRVLPGGPADPVPVAAFQSAL